MWTKQKFEGDAIAAVKLVLSSHSTGKLVIDFSEGTPRSVEWREKVREQKKLVDTRVVNADILSA